MQITELHGKDEPLIRRLMRGAEDKTDWVILRQVASDLTNHKYRTLASTDDTGKIVGVVLFWREPNKYGVVWVSELMVLPAYRLKGVGRVLIDAVFGQFALGTKLRLYSAEDGFYKKLGFRKYKDTMER